MTCANFGHLIIIQLQHVHLLMYINDSLCCFIDVASSWVYGIVTVQLVVSWVLSYQLYGHIATGR